MSAILKAPEVVYAARLHLGSLPPNKWILAPSAMILCGGTPLTLVTPPLSYLNPIRL